MTWGLNYRQKKIEGYPHLCFLNIRLKKDEGKRGEPAPKDEPMPEQKKYVPPEDDPFN
jgi:hypothetical protein